MTNRKSYPVSLTVNGEKITEVIIDPHYKKKHSASMNDAIILKLVKLLDKKFYVPDSEKEGFQYYVADPLQLHGKKYRLVWLLEKKKIYVGVINAFRR